MKKKILCLLLILALLPIGFMFAGCSNKVYSLSNLEADYNAITEDCTAFKVNTVGEGKEIIVDYSVYKDSAQTSFLKNLIETKEPYKKLNTFYNETFNNSMTFAYAYLKDCSKNDYSVNNTLATEVETRLKDLKSALKTIDDATSQLADVVKFSLVSGDAFDTSCMYELRNVFEKYETLLTASLNFNNALARVYFDYALPGSNLNYSKFYIDDSADELNFKNANTIGLAIGYLTPKVKFQIVNLTQCMFELNIKAGNLPSKFTTAPFGEVDAFFASYKEKLVALNKELDPSKSAIIMADDTKEKATTLLNNLIRLYNVQSSITNDAEMYLTAFATVQYLKVKNDVINATVTEKMCLDIIENYNSIINDYQTVLTDLVTFIAELN